MSRVAAGGIVLALALLGTATAQDKSRADDTGRLYFSVDVGMNFYSTASSPGTPRSIRRRECAEVQVLETPFNRASSPAPAQGLPSP